MRTVVGVFHSFPEASRVAADLAMSGIPNEDIFVAGDQVPWKAGFLKRGIGDSLRPYFRPPKAKPAVIGAAIGGVICAAISGVGSLAAYGLPKSIGAGLVLIAMLLGGLIFGSIGGSVVAKMFSMGVSNESIPFRAEAAREHGIVVAAHVSDLTAPRAVDVMRTHGGDKVLADDDPWVASAWRGPHPAGHPYPRESSYNPNEMRG